MTPETISAASASSTRPPCVRERRDGRRDQRRHPHGERPQPRRRIICRGRQRDSGPTTGLSPMDAPEIWHARLKEMDENIMLVGHLPHLARLSSLLLTGNAEKIIISFKMAGIVCFKRSEENLWSLQWMLTPEIILSEGRAINSCDNL